MADARFSSYTEKIRVLEEQLDASETVRRQVEEERDAKCEENVRRIAAQGKAEYELEQSKNYTGYNMFARMRDDFEEAVFIATHDVYLVFTEERELPLVSKSTVVPRDEDIVAELRQIYWERYG